jgi:hypothetical protein
MRPTLLSLLLAPLSLACSGPGVADLRISEVSISVTAVASTPDAVSLGEAQQGLGVARAYLSASSLSLLPCDDGAAELVLPARSYDLLGSPAPRERVATAVTELCGLRLDIDSLRQNEPEGVPQGATLYAEGEDAEGIAFAFSTPTASSILLEAVADMPFGDEPLLLALDVSAWLADVPIDEFTTDAEGVQTLVDSRTASALAVYADLDDDQLLDEDETRPVAAVSSRLDAP